MRRSGWRRCARQTLPRRHGPNRDSRAAPHLLSDRLRARPFPAPVSSSKIGTMQTTTRGLTSAEVAERTRQGLVNRTQSSAWRDYATIASRHLFTLFNFIVVPSAVALFWHNEWQA